MRADHIVLGEERARMRSRITACCLITRDEPVAVIGRDYTHVNGKYVVKPICRVLTRQ